MKAIKRVLSIILVVAMLSANGLITAFAVGADDPVILVIESDKDTAASGQEVTYTVSLKNAADSNLAAIQFNLVIPDALEYVSHTVPSSNKFVMSNYNETAANFAAIASNGINEDEWVIMTAVYRVKDGVAGNIEMSFTNTVLGDANNTEMPFTLQSCTVTVPKAEAGTPVPPVVASITDTTITVKTVSGQKYMIRQADEEAPTAGSSGWQDTGVFDNLTPNTAYRIYTYIPESATVAASEIVYTETTTSSITITDILVPVSELTGKVYDGFVQQPTFGGTLTRNQDYSVSYEISAGSTGSLEGGLPVGAGIYTVTVSGIGDYVGSFTKEFTITAKDISGVTVSSISGYYYDGMEKTPEPAVTDDNYLMIKDQDYTYGYENNVYVGAAKVIITGTGNYQGTREIDFSISAADQAPVIVSTQTLAKGGNTLDLLDLVRNVQGNAAISFQIVSGNAALLSNTLLTSAENDTGDVVITVNIEEADINKDGTAEYNSYTGTNEIIITVTDKNISELPGGVTQQSCVYGEVLSEPVLTEPQGTIQKTISYTGTLNNGGEYSSSEKPTEAGNYTVTVICETTDTIYSSTANFTIFPAAIEHKTITLSQSTFEYDGTEKAVLVTSVGDLTADDYETSGTFTATNAGEYTVIVTGKGNYQGTTQATWEITPIDITITGATAEDRSYSAGNLTVSIIAVTFDNATFVLNRDYTVTGTMENDRAGDNKGVTITATLVGLAATNYRLISAEFKTTVNIQKAATEDQAATSTAKYGNEGAVSLSAFVVSGGTVTIRTVTDSDGILVQAPAVDPATNTLTYTLVNAVNNIGKTAQVLLNVASENYADYIITVTITVSDKLTQEITASDLNCVYGDTGGTVQANGYGTITYRVVTGDDVIEVDATGNITIKKAGTATIQIDASGDETYAAASKTIRVLIAKRTINISADNQSMTVGSALPEFTVSYENLPRNVNVADIFENLPVASTAADGKTAGSFEITVTTPTLTAEADNNYQIGNIKTGTLTVSTISHGGSGSSSSATYTVSTDAGRNGSVSVSPARASYGNTVTITVNPDDGYELDTLTVTTADGDEISVRNQGNNQYTFIMPRSKVTIEASFAEIKGVPTLAFTDVDKTAYYYDAVAWAVENGITNGTSAATFSPNASCTRAQMMTFLWRAAGSPKATGSNPFTDVSTNAYYYDAVLWAVENGITNGTSDTTFSPGITVTRGQTVTFLWRADNSPVVSSSSFVDVPANAYYTEAVAWATASGITNGTSATTFSPDNACTRGQIVTFLYRAFA